MAERRWNSSHRVQAAVNKVSLAEQVEMTRPHLTPPLRALDPAPSANPRPPPLLLQPKPVPAKPAVAQPLATAHLPPIAHPPPPPDWHMPQRIEPALPDPIPLTDRGAEPASVGLLAATSLVWLLAIVLGTLAALMARE